MRKFGELSCCYRTWEWGGRENKAKIEKNKFVSKKSLDPEEYFRGAFGLTISHIFWVSRFLRFLPLKRLQKLQRNELISPDFDVTDLSQFLTDFFEN
jgi:hypothetical protein